MPRQRGQQATEEPPASHRTEDRPPTTTRREMDSIPARVRSRVPSYFFPMAKKKRRRRGKGSKAEEQEEEEDEDVDLFASVPRFRPPIFPLGPDWQEADSRAIIDELQLGQGGT